MLKLYDHLEVLLEEDNKRQWFFETKLNFFVSDIMEKLSIEDVDEISSSLNRAFEACNSLNLPFECHFKRVYRFDGTNLFADWKISPFACYLIIINCSPEHEHVARAQLFFAMNQVTNNNI